MAILSIAILGGDLRQCYAAEYLRSCGWNVTCFHTLNFPCDSGIILENSLPQALKEADIILLPTPVSKDGVSLFQADGEKPPCLLEELWDSLHSGQIIAAYSLSPAQTLILEERNCQAFQFSRL